MVCTRTGIRTNTYRVHPRPRAKIINGKRPWTLFPYGCAVEIQLSLLLNASPDFGLPAVWWLGTFSSGPSEKPSANDVVPRYLIAFWDGKMGENGVTAVLSCFSPKTVFKLTTVRLKNTSTPGIVRGRSLINVRFSKGWRAYGIPS